MFYSLHTYIRDNASVTSSTHLKISVDNVLLMQVAKSWYDFRAVEACPILREDSHPG